MEESIVAESLEEGDLRDDFVDGLYALQTAVEDRTQPVDADVKAIGRDADDIVVRLGVWRTDPIRRSGVEYVHDEYVVYVRIPQHFPTGVEGGKGFVSAPPLDRGTGELNNNEWRPQLGDVVEQETDHDDAQAYSYNWENVSFTDAEDMVKFLDVAGEFLRQG